MVLEALFAPLLEMNATIAVTIFAIIILIVINIFYKLLINQKEAKMLKEQQKDISKRIQEARKAGQTDKMNALMKESLTENSKLMRMTMKPMIVSLIVVVIFLPGLQTFYNDSFASLEGDGVIALAGTNYTYNLDDEKLINVEGSVPFDGPCDTTCFLVDERLYETSQEGENAKVSTVVAVLPVGLPVIGVTAGWLGWYIIVSIPLVVVIRKLMKIYI